MKKKSSWKSKFNILLLVLITIIVLYFSLRDDYQAIIHEIINMNIGWLVASILLFMGSIYVRSLSLHNQIKEFKKNARMRDTLRLSLVTQFFNAVTPFATGGQPFQVYYLNKAGISVTKATNIIIQNFIVYQIALVILGMGAVISNYFLHIFKEAVLLKQLVTIGFILNTTVIVVLLLIAFAKNFNKFVSRILIKILNKLKLVKDKKAAYQRWENYINDFTEGATILVKNKKLFIKNVILNFAGLCALYLVPLTVAYSMGVYTSFDGFNSVVASAYVMLMGSFVPIPGGTGGLEFGFIAFYGNFVRGSTLNAIMLMWRFITYYFGMILGACALYIKTDKKRKDTV